MGKTRCIIKTSLGQIKDVLFSFGNELVKAHFEFALVILDILGEINQVYQVKYGFLPYFMDYLASLYGFLKNELGKMIHEDVSGFPCLDRIEMEDIGPFISILKHLITNLTVRFYTISFSLNKRSIRPLLDYENMTVNSQEPVCDPTRCGLPELLRIFGVRHTAIPTELYGTYRVHGLEDEWMRFMDLALGRRDEVWTKTHGHELSLSSKEKNVRQLLQTHVVPNLIDAFGVVERGNFPNLWRFVVRVLTIMPTTVGCEQSFSYFKRTQKINMTEDTAKILLFARLSLYRKQYSL